MNITEIDRNFSIETKLPEKDIAWADARSDAFVCYGLVKTEEGYTRMPRDIAREVNEGVGELCDNTSGGRVRLCTDSPYIAVKAVYPGLCRMPHMPISGSSGFDLYKEIGGRQFYLGAYIPSMDTQTEYEGIVYTGNATGEPVNYVLNFPPYNALCKLYIGLKEGSCAETPNGYHNRKPVVFYGSSITQGACASRPGNIYQNFLSRALNMDYISLGFSGSARGEKAMAEYMAGLEMSVFVADYDHNAPDATYLADTHYALYEVIRKRCPDLPYIMISHPDPRINDALMRRKVIMESYVRAVNAGDRNVYFIDGDSLFAGLEYDACTVDVCHPNDLGMHRMAQGMLPLLKKLLY